MSDLAVLGIEARTQGVQQADGELQQLSRTAASTQQSANRLRGANDNLSNSLRNTARSVAVLHGPLGGIASRFSSLASVIAGSGIALGAFSIALAGAGFAAQRALSEFQAFETQQLVLEGVLQATGGAAGRTADDLERLAQGIASATLASTQEVRQAAAQLLTFRTVSEETFDRTLELAQDLATVGFGSIQSQAVALGRALEDPITGLNRLQRSGISFTASQQDVIRSLVETGSLLEAQALILDRVEEQVGGAGARAGSGLAGAWDALGQAIQNNLVVVGEQIAEYTRLEQVISGVADALQSRVETPDYENLAARLRAELNEIEQDIADWRAIAATSAAEQATASQAIIRLREQERVLAAELGVAELELERIRVQRGEAEANAEAARQQAAQERIASVEQELQRELDRMALTEEQIALQDALRRAGVDAADTEAQSIRNLVGQLQAAKDAREAEVQAKRQAEQAAQALARQREREAQQIDSVIENLRFEIDQLGRTSQEQRLYNELKQAGVDINSAAGQEIARLVEQLHREEQALRGVADAASSANAARQQGIDTIAGSWSQGGGSRMTISSGIGSAQQAAFANEFGPGGFDVRHTMSGRGMGVQGARINMTATPFPTQEGLQFRHDQWAASRPDDRALQAAGQELTAAARDLQSAIRDDIRDTERRLNQVINMPMPRPDPYAERSADVFYDMNAERHFLTEQQQQINILEQQLDEQRAAERHLQELIRTSRDNPARFASHLRSFMGDINTTDPSLLAVLDGVSGALRTFSRAESAHRASISQWQAAEPGMTWTIGDQWAFEDQMLRDGRMQTGFALGMNRGGQFDVPGAPGVDKPFMLGLSGGERVQVVTPDMRRQIEEQDNERQGTQDNRTQHVHIYVDREAMGQQGRADPEIAGRNLARVVARQLGRM